MRIGTSTKSIQDQDLKKLMQKQSRDSGKIMRRPKKRAY